MACETCKEDLEMMNVDFGGPDGPLNTQFLLPCFEEKKLPKILWKRIGQVLKRGLKRKIPAAIGLAVKTKAKQTYKKKRQHVKDILGV